MDREPVTETLFPKQIPDLPYVLQQFTVSGTGCCAALPASCRRFPEKHFPVVYLMGESDIQPVAEFLASGSLRDIPVQGDLPCILVGVSASDWNSSFSPWAVPRLGKNLGPFSGGGRQTLALLESRIKPYIDTVYRTLPDAAHTGLAGYSLAGLLVLYALYNSTSFSRFACMSGSLWYPDWITFIQTHLPSVSRPHIYLSLGDREKESRNRTMAEVGTCTEETVAALQRTADSAVYFEYNSGGHFNDVSRRIANGISYVTRDWVI